MLLAFTWWLAGDYVKDSVQKQLTRPQAQIRVQHGKDARYVIRVEITPYSSEAFEEVKVEVDLSLRSTSNDIEGHVSSVDGSTRAVDITMLPEGRAFEVTSLKDKRGPITLQQREALEIRFHEASCRPSGRSGFTPRTTL